MNCVCIQLPVLVTGEASSARISGLDGWFVERNGFLKVSFGE